MLEQTGRFPKFKVNRELTYYEYDNQFKQSFHNKDDRYSGNTLAVELQT